MAFREPMPAARPMRPGCRRRSRAAAALPLLLLLSACSGVLDPQGPVGSQDRLIMMDALVIMLAIVIPTIIATLVFAWWFRSSNGKARYRPDFVYSGRIELIVWGIPTLVILFLGGVIWIGSHQLDPAAPLALQTPAGATRTPAVKPIEVQVVSLDWKWLFIYPDQGVASVNELVMPVGAPVRFSLTSASVMNSFFIPQLGSMMAAMNGMTTHLSLQADKPGNYLGESAQYSGDGFTDMRFAARAVSSAQFTAWIEAAKSQGPALNVAAYHELMKQSLDVRPFTYRAVQPGLFEAIAERRLPSGPGPTEGRPNPQTSPRPEH
ncbi:MAG TPA: ubiquinol oxidase subunit II [Sphingomonas sp.]|nr:ubiquinol oxidase subunit II [Sphingomonas sp.]